MLHPNMAKQFIEVWNRQKDKVKTRARQYSRHAFKSSLCLMTCQTWETLLAATLWLSVIHPHELLDYYKLERQESSEDKLMRSGDDECAQCHITKSNILT